MLDLATGRLVGEVAASPAAASPDMGGLSADGRMLWLPAGTTASCTRSHDRRRLLAKIQVGTGPHGLCVCPQPGRYSLGHTGILR